MADEISGARLDAAIRDFNEYEIDYCSVVGGYPAVVDELYGIIAIASTPDHNDSRPELQMFTSKDFVDYVEDLLDERDRCLQTIGEIDRITSWRADDDMEDDYDELSC